jgi:hypothetical protein
MDRWSAEAHIVRDGVSRDTVIHFERTSPGAWTVSIRCQITETRTKTWQSHKGIGRAQAQNGILVGRAGGLGQFVIASGSIMFDDPRCASGPAILGTGD